MTATPKPRNQTRPGHGRVIGAPGRSTKGQYREAMQAYRRVPFGWFALGTALASGLVALGAHGGGYPITPAVGVTVLLAAGSYGCAKFPSVAATTATVAALTVLSIPSAVVYGHQGSGGNGDVTAAIASMAATLILTGMLAHRTSRGRPWLTTLLAGVTALVAGPVLLITVAPWLGFFLAWMLIALVLVLRGGGLAWLLDQYATLGELVARRRRGAPLPAPVARLADKHEAEERTGALLSDLPSGHTVFHDRRLPDGTLVDHVAIGPTGVHVITSHQRRGRVTDHAEQGLTLNGDPLAPLLRDSLHAADATAAALRLHEVNTTALVVFHDAILPAPKSRVGLSAGPDTVGEVLLLAPSALVDAITDAPVVHTDRYVARLVRRIDRMLPPATARTKPNTRLKASFDPGSLTAARPRRIVSVVLDEQGQPLPGPTPAQPLFNSDQSGTTLHVGALVTVLTDQGTYDGYRVVAEPTGQGTTENVIHVPLCSDDEWLDAVDEDRDADVEFWYPLDSVQPVDNPVR